MDGILLPNGKFINNNEENHDIFFKKILNYDINKKITKDLLLNEFFFRGHIVFVEDTVIHFPVELSITKKQLRFIRKNRNKFSKEYQKQLDLFFKK